MNRNFIEKLRLISIRDIISLIFIFPIAYVISLFFRRKNKNLILICESEKEARDNGYWLFKYIRKNHPEENVIYVIDLKSPDAHKVKELGECIQYWSFKHWVYYLSAGVNVSTQKAGNPNAAVFNFMEVYLGLKTNKVFLQHGITVSDAKWLYYENTKMRGFICGAEQEYEEIKEKFGYPSGYVQYLGFPRFDNLHNTIEKNNQILVMPTWREWLNLNTKARTNFNEGSTFTESEYFKKWNEFLLNKDLKAFLEVNDLTLIFYPHRNMQNNLQEFKTSSDNIILADWKKYDIQELLKESAFLITDYSSVFMDFAYMRKPVLFYQFDYKKFREGQYEEGYYDYKDGFGKSIDTLDELISDIQKQFNNKWILEDRYKEKIEKFFRIYDNQNSKRVYSFIKEIIGKKE
ncbi:CDP-glycerol glycerophosphotransferase family protein [Streptococcus mitis]|uniref:CDP-glycerol glycerophosphotransferase family protein n=1 Tax=Streptococcus mitis TaxID=28037 RepID=UPI00290F11B3|nr:CDP-glycerol glycerophosphotransferase family protein [Streptococcus mitis]